MSEVGWKHAGTYMYQQAHTVTKKQILVISVAVTLACPEICRNVQDFALMKPIGPLRHILTPFPHHAEVPDFRHCRGVKICRTGPNFFLCITGSTKTSWFN